MKIDVAQISDKGPRSENEDATLVLQLGTGPVIAVADGLGGHFGGKVAANIAMQSIADGVGEAPLKESLLNAHQRILEAQLADPLLKGMGTTATVVRIVSNKLFGAHCGDTRCVVQRGDGIRKLTVEHTEAQRLFDAGKLTKEQLLTYPRRNILDSALGASTNPKIDEFEFDVLPGDKVIITSDGVHELIKLRQLLEIVSPSNTATNIVNLIAKNVEGLGPEDNYSAVVAIIE